MAQFFDLHSHMLCGVDDGAKNPEEMFSMLEMAYADGIRAICLTPHYSPYLFGDTSAQSEQAFVLLDAYVKDKHPDMQLYLAHELGYHGNCISALNQGICRSLGNGRYVLVDFSEMVTFFEIKTATEQLRQAGYQPVLAHAERYRCMRSEFKWFFTFVERGGKIQINASSVSGENGFFAKSQCKRLLTSKLAHVISTDAHNLTTRPPKMSVCIDRLKRLCDAEYIYDLTWKNAERIIKNERF